MKRSELEKLTVRELRAMGQELDITVGADLKKADIVDVLATYKPKPKKATVKAKTEAAKPAKATLKAKKAAPEVEASDDLIPPSDMKQEMEVSKFDLGPEHHIEPWGLPVEIPQRYEEERVALLVRDPNWAYAYWEVTQGRIAHGRSQLGDSGEDAGLALRLYDITGVEFDGANAHCVHDMCVYERMGDWYLDRVAPGRSFVIDIGLKAKDGRFVTLARSNVASTPRDRVSEVLDEEWVLADSEFRKIYALSGAYGGDRSTMSLSSADIMRTAGGRVAFGVASPGMSSMSLMSPGMRKERERGFWFVLNTELVVYGATEPDATVTVQGAKINLRPDGTFTMRFALPDGVQNIPVSASSADGVETRWITPEVTRTTSYAEEEQRLDKEEAA